MTATKLFFGLYRVYRAAGFSIIQAAHIAYRRAKEPTPF